MKMNFRKISRAIVASLLCLCMALASLSMVACNNEEPPVDDTVQEVEVLRVIDDVDAGERIPANKYETVKVRADAVPEGAITEVNDMRTKYTKAKLYAGDFITADKLVDSRPETNSGVIAVEKEVDYKALGYVVITDYVNDENRYDCADAINKAITENPGKTIYFPDGEYNISSPIIIPADKSVSLSLGHLAVVKAVNWKDTSLPMVRMGVQETAAAAEGDEPEAPTMEEAKLDEQVSSYIIGGNFYANSLASGIAVEGGKDTLLFNVAIKGIVDFGIHVLRGNNEIGASYVNIDNVNITGIDKSGSIGVWLEGTYNTVANMRIYRIQYGTYAEEGAKNNVLRNLHPLASSGHGDATVSFYDKSDGNTYDICYSDQFSTGYVVYENTRSVMNGGFCYWYSPANGYHVAIRSVGAYNSIWVGGKSAQSSGHDLDVDANILVCKDEAGTELLWIPCGCEGEKYRGQDDNSDGKCDHCGDTILKPTTDVAGDGVVLYPIYARSSKQYYYFLDYYTKTNMKTT